MARPSVTLPLDVALLGGDEPGQDVSAPFMPSPPPPAAPDVVPPPSAREPVTPRRILSRTAPPLVEPRPGPFSERSTAGPGIGRDRNGAAGAEPHRPVRPPVGRSGHPVRHGPATSGRAVAPFLRGDFRAASRLRRHRRRRGSGGRRDGCCAPASRSLRRRLQRSRLRLPRPPPAVSAPSCRMSCASLASGASAPHWTPPAPPPCRDHAGGLPCRDAEDCPAFQPPPGGTVPPPGDRPERRPPAIRSRLRRSRPSSRASSVDPSTSGAEIGPDRATPAAA